VLDSTFLIDLLRGVEAAGTRLNELVGQRRPLRVPAMVLLEVAGGAQRPDEAAQRIAAAFLIPPVDEQIAREGARIGSALIRKGRFPGWTDIAIAATAIHFDEELVSRNERHFRNVAGLLLETY